MRQTSGCWSSSAWSSSRSPSGVAHPASTGSGRCSRAEECTAKVRGREVALSTEQAENAALITAISVQRGMPARAATIALATAYQESDLCNLEGGDRDSLGLFQQRPSQGWGTPEQILDPVYATNAFYDALAQVDGYETMEITEAAQHVQRSGFPEAYADHEADARVLASALTGNSPHAFTCVVDDDADEAGDELTAERADPPRRRRTPRRAGRSSARSRSAGSRRAASVTGTWRARRTTTAARSTSSCGRSTPDNKDARLGDRALPRRQADRLDDQHGHLRRPDLDRRLTLRRRLARLRPAVDGPATARSSSTATTCTSTCSTERQPASRATAASTRSSVAVKRHPHVLGAGGAVELARGDQDPPLGEPGDGLPAVLAAGGPEVERRLGVVDPEAGGRERRAQLGPPGGVPGVLLDGVLVVVERRRPSRPAAGRASSGRGSCVPRAARRPRAGSPATKAQR